MLGSRSCRGRKDRKLPMSRKSRKAAKAAESRGAIRDLHGQLREWEQAINKEEDQGRAEKPCGRKLASAWASSSKVGIMSGKRITRRTACT